jgi:hypothetical protein
MHEAGLLAAAVAEALAAAEPARSSSPGTAGARRPRAIEIRVHDPMHVSPESAYLHAQVALRARGLDDVEILVTADPVVCAICDASNVVRAVHPFCDACGFPLPDRDGHAVEAVVRWEDEVPASAGT